MDVSWFKVLQSKFGAVPETYLGTLKNPVIQFKYSEFLTANLEQGCWTGITTELKIPIFIQFFTCVSVYTWSDSIENSS